MGTHGGATGHQEKEDIWAISYHVSAVWNHGEAGAGAQITLLLFISHSVRDPKPAKINKIKLSRMVHSQANHKIIKNSL